MVCEVEYLEDEKEDGRGDDELESLGQEVLDVLKNVLNLNFKLKGMDVRELEGKIDFSEKEKLSPREISFWVASMFTGECHV